MCGVPTGHMKVCGPEQGVADVTDMPEADGWLRAHGATTWNVVVLLRAPVARSMAQKAYDPNCEAPDESYVWANRPEASVGSIGYGGAYSSPSPSGGSGLRKWSSTDEFTVNPAPDWVNVVPGAPLVGSTKTAGVDGIPTTKLVVLLTNFVERSTNQN